MCSGPLAGKMLAFSIPLMFSGILQLLFNAVDIIVVGRFISSRALGAVGSTSTLIFLLTGLFMGLSVGANVLTSRYRGAGKEKEISEVVHTAVALSLLCGVLMSVAGIAGARGLLTLMGTPEDILNMAVLYMQIYFIGMPAGLSYNMGAAILRAVGDTKRPLYFLLFAGSMNVVLNLLFTLVLKWGIAGIAFATICSQTGSALLVLSVLKKSEGALRLNLKEIRLHKVQLKRILRIGIPASLQSILFSFSNVVIQSSINSFGSAVVAGSAAAANIEGFVTTSMNAFHQTTMNFTSQNYGARHYQRINKVLRLALVFDAVIGLILGSAAYFFGKQLLGIYVGDAKVVSYGLIRLLYTCPTYFLLGTMDVFVGALRGVGYSVLPMVISLTGACGLRVLWVYTIFRENPTLEMLFLSYPVTWLITALVQFICTIYVFRKIRQN